MFKRAGAIRIWSLAPMDAAVPETIDRGFDWGSTAVARTVEGSDRTAARRTGAGLRNRRTGSAHRGGGRK
jgi:hypothetical protein